MASLDKVSLDIAVVLGSTYMPVHQVLRLGRGAVIELDAGENDEVRILANDFPIAKGAVVVSGNRIAVEVKEMLPRTPPTCGEPLRRAFRPALHELSPRRLRKCLALVLPSPFI